MCSCRSFLACNQKEFHFFVFFFRFETNTLYFFVFDKFWFGRHFIGFSPVRNTSPAPPSSVRATGQNFISYFLNILIFFVLFVCVPLDKILFRCRNIKILIFGVLFVRNILFSFLHLSS